MREDYQYVFGQGLGDYFIQLPRTDQPECWMKAIDVVAMPSRWEACGLLAMEALAAGRPIVASNCVGLREVLKDSPARLVPVGDPEKLAMALAEELVAPRDEQFIAFANQACERFNVSNSAAKLAELYEMLAA